MLGAAQIAKDSVFKNSMENFMKKNQRIRAALCFR